MVELRDILSWFELRKLDIGLNHGWNRTQLVAIYSGHRCLSDNLFHCHVLQLAMRQCVPYRLSRRGTECFRYVGKLLLRWSASGFGYHLVWSSVVRNPVE